MCWLAAEWVPFQFNSLFTQFKEEKTFYHLPLVEMKGILIWSVGLTLINLEEPNDAGCDVFVSFTVF